MKFMPVVIPALSVLVLLVAVMACGNDDDDIPRPMTQPTSMSSTVATSANDGDDTSPPMNQSTNTPSATLVVPSATFVVPTATTVPPSAATISAPAVDLSVGETVNGSLDDGDDRDYFRVKGEGNRVYDLSVTLGTLTAPIVVLYASDFSKMKESWGHPDTGETQFVWPGYPGDYYITVEGGDDGGTYTLTLALFPEDHGDDIPFASGISLGEAVEGSMGYTPDFDYFRFRAEAGQLYRVEVATRNRDCWIMRLWDSDETILAYHPFSGDTGSDTGLIVWEATSSGNHYVEVMGVFGEPACDSWGGEYTLTVAPMSLPSEDEHGNSVSSAALIEVGEPVSAGLEYAGDSDYFRFTAQEGRTYRMDVALGTLDSYNYEINLYGPDGDVIDWVPYSQRESGYAWEAPASGEYYVAVASSDNETGSYTLTVTPIKDDHGDGHASATALLAGTSVDGNLDHKLDTDYFKFHAEGGHTYRIEIILDTLYSSTIILYDSASQMLAAGWDKIKTCSDCGDEWAKNAQRPILWEASDSGYYYVAVVSDYPIIGRYKMAIDRLTE